MQCFESDTEQAAAETLKKHISLSVIDDSEGVPLARLREGFFFSDFCDEKANPNPASVHENLVWQLTSVLFDSITLPDELAQFPQAGDRLRKDKLSAFWQKLVEPAASQQVAIARSAEEKAFAALSGHRVADACAHLVSAKNFHLATLVAQIGGKESMRKDIRDQLNDWQRSRVLSEFSQPIRAIYELLAGNVCVCDGTKGAPVEDRIQSFSISKRFGLDWRQAFGLRLWYGSQARDDLDVAVEKFAADLGDDREPSQPHAWYVEQKIPTLWEDEDLEFREDLLWGLMKLYTFEDTDLQSVIRPENSQLSPLDTRLAWQLSRALIDSGLIYYKEAADEKADQATLSLAAQLNNEGSWLEAVFVLLHLTSATARGKSIQNHLAQHAGRIGSEDSESFSTLVQHFKIPTAWIWEAKALYMRSVKRDPRGEVECLIRAGSLEEAHRTLARDVAPQSIVEADYANLRSLLDGFRGKEHAIPEWHQGGEIYVDFLQLLDQQRRGTAVDGAALARLLAGLPAVVEGSRHAGFMETVAIETMSGVVAQTVVALRKRGEVCT
jgi:nuclear pore complex protein Nup98-Nup96